MKTATLERKSDKETGQAIIIFERGNNEGNNTIPLGVMTVARIMNS